MTGSPITWLSEKKLVTFSSLVSPSNLPPGRMFQAESKLSGQSSRRDYGLDQCSELRICTGSTHEKPKHGRRTQGELESPRGVICGVPNASAKEERFEKPGP